MARPRTEPPEPAPEPDVDVEAIAPDAEVESWSFQLKLDWFDEGIEPVGSFMAEGKAVDLKAGAIFTTEDKQVAAGLRDVPWLESAD